ncbi:hypothetical protein KM043_015802 [Ampulex compressa]|nr:hypothetical protein KM043_015802 [Ampulex compressa]
MFDIDLFREIVDISLIAAKRATEKVEMIMQGHRKAPLKLKKAMKQSKAESWSELFSEVKGEPWGRPYKVVMTGLRRQPLPSPADTALREKIVTHLFPEQSKKNNQLDENGDERTRPIAEKELMVTVKVSNNRAPSMDGISNIALKTAIKLVPAIFLM